MGVLTSIRHAGLLGGGGVAVPRYSGKFAVQGVEGQMIRA